MSRTYGSLTNMLIDRDYYDGNIKIGAGVTELCWSDRHAYFIKDIIRNKKGEIRQLVIDGAYLLSIGCGYYEVSKDPKEGYHKEHGERVIKKTRKGNWSSNGTEKGTMFRIGYADEYYDISF